MGKGAAQVRQATNGLVACLILITALLCDFEAAAAEPTPPSRMDFTFTYLTNLTFYRGHASTTTALSKIVVADGYSVLVGIFNGGPGLIAVSTNNVDWQYIIRTNRASLYAIGYGDGKVVAVGKNGYTLVSSNGFDWKEAISPVAVLFTSPSGKTSTL